MGYLLRALSGHRSRADGVSHAFRKMFTTPIGDEW